MVPGGPTGPCEPVQGRKGALASSTHVWPVYGHSSGSRSGGSGLLGTSHAKPRRHPSPPPKAPRSNPAGIPRGSLKKRNFKKRKRGMMFPSLTLRAPTIEFLSAKGAIMAQAESIHPAAQEDQADGPTQLDQQTDDQFRALLLLQKNHGREVRQVLERQQLQHLGDAGILSQKLEREHLPGDEISEDVDDVHERGHFQ